MKNLVLPFLFLFPLLASAQEDSLPHKAYGPDTAMIWHYEDALISPYAGISLYKAYALARELNREAKPVVVAIIDSGVDTAHVDLKDRLWVNPREIAGNGIDDDGNGYVDDIHGWNFIGGPDGYCVNGETLELTRLYARLSKKYKQGGREDDPKYQYYLKVKEDYTKNKKVVRKWYDYFCVQLENYDYSAKTLKSLYGKTDFSEEELRQHLSSAQDAALVRVLNYWLWITENNISRKALEDQKQYYADRISKYYNTQWNPRLKVGDNPDDIHDTLYGNAVLKTTSSGHGTSVAGVIGAERDNNIGIDGIAPNARLMIIRVVPGGDERDKDVALAIFYAVRNGARIINCSFGKNYSVHKNFVDSAVRYARAHNVLIVHAAGNDSKNIDREANYPSKMLDNPAEEADNWIEVGASGQHADRELVAPFSNYGMEVDLFAPGVHIRSTAMKNKYSYSNGTSLAAPVVSGVAALVLSYFPDLNYRELKECLVNSGIDYGKLKVVVPSDYDQFRDKKKPRTRKKKFKKLCRSGRVLNAWQALRYAEQHYGRGTS